MKASRLVAVGLVAAAGLWIASGYIFPSHHSESLAAARPGEKAEKLFRVGVMDTKLQQHSRKLMISGRTEAAHKVMAATRTNGVLTELRVVRGQTVKKGDVLAILSDEAREAQVTQAQALVNQRKVELDAKRRLIEMNALPKLDLVSLEAQLKIAEAALAGAQAERDRGIITAPWSGIVTDVPAEVGGAAFSVAGKEIAQIVDLDPILAVVEVSERKLAGVKVGDTAQLRLVTGETVEGRIRFVSKSASATTRSYRIEVEAPNHDLSIPDGITAEVAIKLTPTPATRVPRSALTFSSAGELGVRSVGKANTVEFIPVSVAEDEQAFMWVAGIPDQVRVIVQGQDFVREGQRVEAVDAPEQTAAK